MEFARPGWRGAAVGAALCAALVARRFRQRLRSGSADAQADEALRVSGRRRLSPEGAMDLLFARNDLMHTPESVRRGRTFEAKPSDVFVATYPKCGTTWMQQICHQLRGGSMDFSEICEVIPWEITALDCGQDLDAPQVCEPRVWKSHEHARHIARGAKYIVVLRDPRDVLNSFFHFLADYFEVPEITLEVFARRLFLGAGSNHGGYWDWVLGWLPYIRKPNVLVLFFEDMKHDLPQVVRKVQRFMETPECHVSTAVERSSFAYMRDHGDQFDDNFVRGRLAKRMGLAGEQVRVGKVRPDGGQVGQGGKAGVPQWVLEKMEQNWQASLGRYGWSSYGQLRREFGLQLPAGQLTPRRSA